MGKHTPGPWSVDPDRPFVVTDDGHNPDDILYSELDGDVGMANARLAAASPQMMAALRDVEAFLGAMFGRAEDSVIPETVTLPLGVPVKLGDIARDIRAAIAATEANP